jgi:AcrR family transcriptional regulator
VVQAVADQHPSKREIQKEARRNAIIDAGFQEFALQGFTATKLDDVAVRAGIGKGTIYLYFDSKESLFEEVIRKNIFPLRDEARTHAAEFQGSATQLLTIHFHRMYAALHAGQMPQLVAMVMGEASRFPKIADFFFKEVVRANQELVTSILQRGIDSGEFRDSFPVDFTQILIAPAMISAIWRLQFSEQSPLDIETYAAAHVDFVLHGLKPDA